MTCSRIIGELVLRGLGYAAGGAASGAAGAAILGKAGYVGYSVLEGTRVGAAGNAVVGPVMSLASEIINLCCNNKNKSTEKSKKDALGEIILSIGTSTLGGMLGHAMLSHIAEMSLEQTAAALAVGSSSIIGGVLVTVLVMGSCATVGVCIVESCASTNIHVNLPSLNFWERSTEIKNTDIESPEHKEEKSGNSPKPN